MTTTIEPIHVARTDFDFSAQREGTFNGRQVQFATDVNQYAIHLPAPEDGKPGNAGTVVATTYRALHIDGLPVDLATRPVVFFFNGGPLVPAIYLHLLAFGPSRVQVSTDLGADPATFPVFDNPHCPLDAADLVFFDPIGTGFSEVSGDTAEDAFFSVASDAEVFAEFFVQWGARYQREASPKFIFGESYGTARAAVSAGKLVVDRSLRLDGVYLFGQAVNIVETVNRPENVMSYVVTLPTLAVLGAYHGLSATPAARLPELVETATAYAQTTYLPALLQGQRLPDAELRKVANELAALTGVPAEVFVSHRLRIGKVAFRHLLLREQGRVLGGMDGRYTASADAIDQSGDASAVLAGRLASAQQAWFEQHFDQRVEAKYSMQAAVKGFDGWGWGASTPFSDWRFGKPLADAMMQNPALRLVVGVGYHDTFTTYGAARYAIDQSEWPLDRVAFRAYFGGHMAYTVDASLVAMARDVRDWVTGTAMSPEWLDDCDVSGSHHEHA